MAYVSKNKFKELVSFITELTTRIEVIENTLEIKNRLNSQKKAESIIPRLYHFDNNIEDRQTARNFLQNDLDESFGGANKKKIIKKKIIKEKIIKKK
jgi:hypothetical protein